MLLKGIFLDRIFIELCNVQVISRRKYKECILYNVLRCHVVCTDEAESAASTVNGATSTVSYWHVH